MALRNQAFKLVPSTLAKGATNSLFIPCPNYFNETGLDRDKLILNPTLVHSHPVVNRDFGLLNSSPDEYSNLSTSMIMPDPDLTALEQCFFFGQLLGVVIRSKSVLDLDIVDAFWKQLQNAPLSDLDLRSYDYTTWSNLQFRDPRDGHLFDEAEFDSYYENLSYVTTLSDSVTKVACSVCVCVCVCVCWCVGV